MLVDDEADILSVLKRGLRKHGFIVDAFSDPADALRSFEPYAYDLLLCDIRLPKMSGFQLYREIRELDAKIKVIFLTAFELYREEFEKLFPGVGARFIRKPISANGIVRFINGESRE